MLAVLCPAVVTAAVPALGSAPDCDVPKPPPVCRKNDPGGEPRGRAPVGELESVVSVAGGVRVRGWVIDPDGTAAVGVRISVSGVVKKTLTASENRPDVAAAHPRQGADHGFDVLLAAMKGHPRICVQAVDKGPREPVTLGCQVLSAGPPAAPAGQATLSVATLNILGNDDTARAGGLPGFDVRISPMAAALRGFDVVGLQEVADASEAERLAHAAGFPYHTVGSAAGVPDQAILSRHPLSDVRRLEGPKPGCVLGINCGGPVWILAATADVHGQPVRIVNTHLSGDYAPQKLDRTAWRAAQAKYVKDVLVTPYRGHVVVVGDFNGDDSLVIAKGGPLLDAADTAPSVFPGPDGQPHCGDRIDLILPRPPMKALSYDGVYGGPYCPPAGMSDHPRVAAVLTLPKLAAPKPVNPEALCALRPRIPACLR
ncbi:endonuclease/exonuclease/phosphatase family protein [Sphaerisporangium aureirubrum]|uniref:Endonuclease/exonuclease/phosphatase family protein n=1 Tax=Sphaerisporangium aureirubrum TaxID=1544736 RepID=A0ABW1NGL1_9ACTN